MKKYSFMLAVLFAFIGIGCSSGGGNSDTIINTTTISGYAEDDPISSATVSISNTAGDILETAITDENGFYSLDSVLKKDTVYYVKVIGVLNDKNITMNSILNYDGNNSSVNINPLTELKYQLVKIDGKSIDEAEILVREYFNIPSGRTLENNRFSTSDIAYIGMRSVAEIYNGTLPIDSIGKIREDIIINASLDVNETQDFAYRSLVKADIKLSASSLSLALGDNVTVNLLDIDELSDNYVLKWTGLPNDINGSGISKTFTVNDFAQDVFVGASLYKVDGNRSSLVSSDSIKINFYKELAEQNLTVVDSSVDNNFTAGENLNVTIPAGTLSNGDTIKIVKQQINSDTSLVQFSIDTGSVTDGNITFHYEYNPSVVTDPRSLQITLQTSTGPQVVRTDEIDYVNHIVKFNLALSSNLNRSASNHRYRVIIDLVKKEPTNDEVANLYIRYMSYIEKIINSYGNDTAKSQAVLNNLKSDLGKEKFILLMKRKHESGEYYYDILATAINYMIAKDSAELMFNSDISWVDAKQAYYQNINGGCINNNSPGESQACYRLNKNKYKTKLEEADKVLSAWVGNAKLTPDQTSFIKIAKIIANQALLAKSIQEKITSGKVLSVDEKVHFYMGVTVTEALDSVNIHNVTSSENVWTPNEMQGYYINAMIDAAGSIVSGASKFNFISYAIGFGVNRAFDILKYQMINSNREATFPLILALSKDYTALAYSDTNMTMANGFSKNEFLNYGFPENTTGKEEDYRNSIIQAPDYHLSEDRFESMLGSTLDPNKRFERAFLQMDTLYQLPPLESNTNDTLSGPGSTLEPTSNPNEIYHNNYDLLNPYERAFVYTGFRYMYGDPVAKEQFDYLANGSIMLAQSILFSVNEISKTDIVDDFSLLTGEGSIVGGNNADIRIKTTLQTSLFQELKDKWFNIWYSANDLYIQNFKNISSFQSLMETAKLKLTTAQLEALNIKKIKVETYGVGLEYSSSDNAWVLNQSEKVNDTFEATENINSLFTYDSTLDKNVLSFATLFASEDFTQFDNKLVGLKITLVFEKDGRDKILSKDFVFTTLSNTENLIDTNFSGATLKSNVRDAVTGNPVVGAFVTLSPGGLSSLTDSNGNYEVSNLAAGQYTIIISKEGYKQIEAVLTLEEDETKIYEASLSIDDEHTTTMGKASITIKDAFNANTITNGYIKIRDGQNNTIGDVVENINSDGNNTLQIPLFPGIYTIEAGANGYTKSYATVSIIGDTTVVKEISISPVLAENQTRIVLSWGENPSDLDSHLVKKVDGNESYHIYYGDSNPTNADAALDIDITSSYGPETVTINEIDSSAVYIYYVHNFSAGEDSVLPDSGAKVDVYLGDTSRTFYIPNEEGQYWKVFEIVNGNIVPCTENCVLSTDTNITRTLNREALLFQNLPRK